MIPLLAPRHNLPSKRHLLVDGLAELGFRGIRKIVGATLLRQPGNSLWWWVEHKLDTLLNVALQAVLAGFEELFLVIVYLTENVVGSLNARGLWKCQHELVDRSPRTRYIRQAQ